MIAELTLKDDLQYGVEWYIKNRMDDGNYTLKTLGNLGVTTTAGLAYQFISDSQKFQAVINAAASKNDIHILSNPRLMVNDNQEAVMQIGNQVPVVSSEVSVQANTGVQRNINYRDTGVILRVKPTIHTEGLLTLTISQEVSEAQTNTTSNLDSPTILLRRISTNVVAGHGQSIVLGGLIGETKSSTINKVPLVGDIPLLGNLFKFTSRTTNRTELVVILTPTILSDLEDAVRVANEFKEELLWFKE